MKKIALMLILCSILIGGASAYIVIVTGPETIDAGEVLKVNGTSNLPAGFTITIDISRFGVSDIITENQVTIQENGSFSTTFNTSTLEKGTYRVEVEENSNYVYGSSSKLWFVFDVIDRRSELHITSPLIQPYEGTLRISGIITTIGNSGLKLEVNQEGKTIYGPEYISTSSGAFNISVPLTSGGVYNVILTDNTSYRWITQFTILASTPTPTVTTEVPSLHEATAIASRSQPVYFKVETNSGDARAFTSSGVDWVMEYVDETGTIKKVNSPGSSSEEVRITAMGGTMYFKIYPDQFDQQASVTLSVENSRSVQVCTTCAQMFGEPVSTTTEAPLPVFLVLIALGLFILWRRRS
ncbi:MAG: hypothetical protein LUP99_05250 [Methanomicrobiales archaeon]|nr:hypothetical protein [Methanomicrobiales archaeon]